MNHFVRILGQLDGVTGQGPKRRAPCPAHDDSTASLEVALLPNGRVSLKCFAGCKLFDILSALKIDPCELEPDPDEEVMPLVEQLDGSGDPSGVSKKEVSPKDLELRDQVYRAMLDLLPLTDEHRANLRTRGLDDETIERGGYRSIGFFVRQSVVRKLLENHTESQLISIPGFVRKDGKIAICGPHEGMLIPVRAFDRIVALKLRKDSEDGSKYVLLSGNGGPSCGNPVHIPLGTPRKVETVRITEGELKADVAFALSKLATIGIPGVSAWAVALPVLQGFQAKEVRLAFDMDCLVKESVAHCLAQCCAALKNNGYVVTIERWDPAHGKGVDDLLTGSRTPEVLEGDAVASFLASILTTASSGAIPAAFDLDDDIDVAHSEPQETGAENNPDEVMSFPVDIFPEQLQGFIDQVSASVGCPPDLVAVPVLGVAGGAIGASRALQVKPGWLECPRMYLGIVAPPGSAKTPAASHVFRPLFRSQNKSKVEFEVAMVEFEEKQAAWEAAKKLKSQSKAKSHHEAASVLPPRPTKPDMKRFVVVDATTEALAPILERNDRGLVMPQDELTAWILRMNSYRGGKGADRQFYLSCWSGEPAIVDRKSQGGPIIIPRPFLNVIGGIQTDLLAMLADERRRADGFMDRILFAFPAMLEGAPWTDAGVDPVALGAWQHTLDQLFDLKMQVNENEGVSLPKIVHMTVQAREEWIQWFNAHAAESVSDLLPASLKGPWAKFRTYAARLALTVHMLRLACEEVTSEDLDAESMRRAIRLISYFKSHARKVHKQLELTPEDTQSQRAMVWITKHGGQCSPRQLLRANVAGIRKQSEAVKLLRDLVDRGQGSIVDHEAANGKRVSVFVAK